MKSPGRPFTCYFRFSKTPSMKRTYFTPSVSYRVNNGRRTFKRRVSLYSIIMCEIPPRNKGGRGVWAATQVRLRSDYDFMCRRVRGAVVLWWTSSSYPSTFSSLGLFSFSISCWIAPILLSADHRALRFFFCPYRSVRGPLLPLGALRFRVNDSDGRWSNHPLSLYFFFLRRDWPNKEGC